MISHTAPISGISTHSGTYIATAGYDNQLVLWDARAGTAISRSTHDHLANQCSFSSDGQLLVSASSDYTARIWTVPDLRLVAVLDGHSDDIEMAVFSPDDQLVATCSRDRTARIFDVEGKLLAILAGHTADVISVTWMPDSRSVVTSSDDGTIRFWHVETGSEVQKIELNGVETDTLIVQRDRTLVAGDDEGRLSLVIDGSITSIAAHAAGIKRLVLDQQSDRIVSLSYDRQMAVWTRHDGGLQKVAASVLPDIVWPRSCAFLDSDVIVFATFGSKYATYSLAADKWTTDEIVPSRSLNAVLDYRGVIYTVGDAGVVRRNGEIITEPGSLCNFLVAVGEDVLTGGQMGKVFSALTGEVVFQHRSPLNCACSFTAEEEDYCVIGTYTGDAIILRKVLGGFVHHATVQLHRNAIKGICADGSMLFSVSANCEAATFALPDLVGVERWPHAHRKIANGCAVVKPGEFVSVSRDLSLRIWTTGGLREIPSPHRHSIKCVAVNGSLVCTGSYAGRVAIYDCEFDRWVLDVRLSTAGISSLCPHKEDGFLASSYDGNVYTVGRGLREYP